MADPRSWPGALSSVLEIIAQGPPPTRDDSGATTRRTRAVDARRGLDPMALITFDRIAKSFRGKALWEDVSAEVPRQARIGLLGSAACGKTTLLRVLAGREMPERGRVLRARHLRVGWPTAAAFRGSEAGLTVHAYCLEAFARLQAQERELTRLEQDLADPHRAADLLPRYGPLQEEFEGQGGYQYRGRVDRMLDGLGLVASDADRRLGDLQGPDRMRARL
ncbi:MAG TPA: ATP-binding cassette domain-containing protein, partial [Anaerolineales bacterium]